VAVSRPAIVNAPTTTLAEPPAATPLWAAAALSIALHAALLATIGSVLTSAWRTDQSTTNPGSGAPLQAVLAPRAADVAVDEPPPKVPADVTPPVSPPPPVVPASPSAQPMPPGLTQPGTGNASPPRRPPPPPTDVGDIAVGATMDISGFGAAIATRLAQQFPVKPGRLPRLHRTLTVSYPEWALRDRTSAHVDALLLLDAKGNVTETLLEPDDPIFGPAVREALAGAVFLPAQAADTTLPYWIALEFVFAIEPVRPPATKAK
jgi:hypothetical protein